MRPICVHTGLEAQNIIAQASVLDGWLPSLVCSADVVLSVPQKSTDGPLRLLKEALTALRNCTTHGRRLVLFGWDETGPLITAPGTAHIADTLANLTPTVTLCGLNLECSQSVLEEGNAVGVFPVTKGNLHCLVFVVCALLHEGAPLAALVNLKSRSYSVGVAALTAESLQALFLRITPELAVQQADPVAELIIEAKKLQRGGPMPVLEENNNLEKKAPIWPLLPFFPANGGWHPAILDPLRDNHYHFQLLRPRADGSAPLARMLIGVTDDDHTGGVGLAVGVPISDSARRPLLESLNSIFSTYFPSPGRRITVRLHPLECEPPVNTAGTIAVIPVDKVDNKILAKRYNHIVQLAQYVGRDALGGSEAANDERGEFQPCWVLALPPDAEKDVETKAAVCQAGHLVRRVPPHELKLTPLFVLDVHFEATDTAAPLVLSREDRDAISVPVLWGDPLSLVRLDPIQLWALYRSRASSRAALWWHCSSRHFLVVVVKAAAKGASASAIAATHGVMGKTVAVEAQHFEQYAERYARGKPLLLVALDTLQSLRDFVKAVARHSTSSVWILLVCTTPARCRTLVDELRAAQWSVLKPFWQLLDVVLVAEAEIKPLLELQAGASLKLPPMRPYFLASVLHNGQSLKEMDVVSLPYAWIVNFELAMPRPPSNLHADIAAFLKHGAGWSGAGRSDTLPLALLQHLPQMPDVARLVDHIVQVVRRSKGDGGDDVSLLQIFGQGGATTVLWQASVMLAKGAWVVLMKALPLSTAHMADQLLRLAQGVARPIVVVCDDHITLPSTARSKFLRKLYEAGYADVPVVVMRASRWWPGDKTVPAKVDLVLSPFVTTKTAASIAAFLLEVAFAEPAALSGRKQAIDALLAAKGRVHVLELVHCAAGQTSVADVARILGKLDDRSDVGRRGLLAVAALSFCCRRQRPLPLPAPCSLNSLAPAADLFEVGPEREKGAWIILRPYWALSLLVADNVAKIDKGAVAFTGSKILELVEIGMRALADEMAFAAMKQLVRGRRLPRWVELLRDETRRIKKKDRDGVVELINTVSKRVADTTRLLSKRSSIVPQREAQIALLVLLSKLYRKVPTALSHRINDKVLQQDSLERAQHCLKYAEEALALEQDTGGFIAAETHAYAQLNLGLQPSADNAAGLVRSGLKTLLELVRRELDGSRGTVQQQSTCFRLLKQVKVWLAKVRETFPRVEQLGILDAWLTGYEEDFRREREEALKISGSASASNSGVSSPPLALAEPEVCKGEDGDVVDGVEEVEDVDGIDDTEDFGVFAEKPMAGNEMWVPLAQAKPAEQQVQYLAHCFEVQRRQVQSVSDDDGWVTVSRGRRRAT